MRPIISLAVSILLSTVGAVAQEHDHHTPEHLEMLRAMMTAASSHGPVIPQPETINPEAAQTFNITARAFNFSPSQITVNQGDVVTINVSVPANDTGNGGHGILMDTYIENGVDVARGQTRSVTFTATTAGTFGFVCTNSNCGSGHSNMVGTLIVRAVMTQPPQVSAVAPPSGSTAGGTAVTITGSNFQTGAAVTFGGVAATNVVVPSSTSITATTPAHAAGAVDVVVTNPDTKSGTLAGGFTYNTPSPTISSVTPGSGPTSGYTLITITGTSFQSGATVTVGGVAAINVNVVNATTITAMTPLGPTSEQVAVGMDVVVTNPGGLTATAAGAFHYTVPPLAITLITPSASLAAGGSKVSLSGAGFSAAVTSSLTIGGLPATNVQVVDAVTITATVPAHAVAVVDVVLTVGGSTVTAKSGFAYLNAFPRHRAAKH